MTIVALLRLGGTDPGGSLRLTSCSYQVWHSRVLRALYRQGANISRDGVPTASLGNLLQYLITLILIFLSICFSSCEPAPPTLFYMLLIHSFRQQKDPPQTFLLKAEQTQLPQTFLVVYVFQLGGLSLDLVQYVDTFVLLSSCKQEKISRCGLTSAR